MLPNDKISLPPSTDQTEPSRTTFWAGLIWPMLLLAPVALMMIFLLFGIMMNCVSEEFGNEPTSQSNP